VDEKFKEAYASLNAEQKKAVQTIDGPVLVIAGPGTGKTQLLSTRVGYILQKTDIQPQNILALTFTEAGVDAMRQRLTDFLGQAAYDVNIGTYHAFGSELLRRYPEYSESYDFQPADEVAADSIIREILEASAYSNPLKSADTYARDLRNLISDSKRALLTPADLLKIADHNRRFIDKASAVISKTLSGFVRIDKTSYSLFSRLETELAKISDPDTTAATPLKKMALEQLKAALEAAGSSGSTKPLTAWKNDWLAKDSEGNFNFAGQPANTKLVAAADIYKRYQRKLKSRKLYDYDDMILRAIKALEEHPDFKYTIAEKYLYIMLDEFQDTNAAQLRIVELLTDNPVNEGRPNVLAVGDDDQAIYAFQGADHANMYRFSQIYKDVKVINLRRNYRSHRKILEIAVNVSRQIKQRLHQNFEGIEKFLTAAGKNLPPKAEISHYEFLSDAGQYEWVSQKIKDLAAKGSDLNQIAVLAPKHKYLVPLLPYLAAQKLPVRYEKRENILDKPLARQLEQMSRLILALSKLDQPAADALWSEVLSYDFWQLPTELIWRVGWQADAAGNGWTNALLNEDATSQIAAYFLRLKDLLAVTSLEQQLDFLIGVNQADQENFNLPLRSPFFSYYFDGRQTNTTYLELISDLSILRGRLRGWRLDQDRPLGLADFINFTTAHRRSGINILNTSPYQEAESAVNLMTAYQAKGREFTAVFLLAAHDEVWGASSRDRGSVISLPANLNFIRYGGDSDDERLRLLFVAITRAKSQLYLTSYAKTLEGRVSRPLKYIIEEQALAPRVVKSKQTLELKLIEPYWHDRHMPRFDAKLSDLLKPRLDKYQLSPTDLNHFTDLVYAGPEHFFLSAILRFPRGESPRAQYGTAMHETMRWLHDRQLRDGKPPSENQTLEFFTSRLAVRKMSALDHGLLAARGQSALKDYLRLKPNNFNRQDKVEFGFGREGVFSGKAHLTGKVDKLSFDKPSKTITVTDFKTGPSYDRWVSGNVTLHRFRQQLIMYKLLVERSHSFAGWKVDKGILEFIEPPPEENKIYRLTLEFDNQEVERLEKLISVIWQRVQELDLPETGGYPKTMKGIRDFEADLLA
jgi:DNA helicase-2/ATP-dependent DNA helicase PcrA